MYIDAAHGKPSGFLGTDAHKSLAGMSGIVDKHRIITGFTKAMTVTARIYN